MSVREAHASSLRREAATFVIFCLPDDEWNCDLSPGQSFIYNVASQVQRKMPGFDDAWTAVAGTHDGESVSPQLQPLLRQVYADVLAQPPNLPALKTSLTALLEYLGEQGRTNSNCWAVDLFFMSCEGWEGDWTEQTYPKISMTS